MGRTRFDRGVSKRADRSICRPWKFVRLQGRGTGFRRRELLKQKVKDEEIRLLVATDAACEGLNLQRLGSQMNVDMPWNPSRLEQRKGRIQRIGQLRDTIHVVNMRYAGTVEDDVYSVLSERFSDIFAVLGQLPESSRTLGWTLSSRIVRQSVISRSGSR